MPIIGTSSVTTDLGDYIMKIRDVIPDPVNAPNEDGGIFSVATLLRFINDAMDEMCARAPVIMDWSGIQSITGKQVYEVSPRITGIDQLWYDLWPCWRAVEYDSIFTTKVQARSYFFGPHVIHANPRLHLWPAADRTGATTTTTGALLTTDTTIPLTSVANFQPFGFAQVGNEIIRYDTLNPSPTNTLSNVLRGQFDTTAEAHLTSETVTELNVMFKGSRLAKPVTQVSDLMEIPRSLVPILDLAVLASVRLTEQEYQEARALRNEFDKAVDLIAAKMRMKQVQGIQIRTEPTGPLLFGNSGRVYVP